MGVGRLTRAPRCRGGGVGGCQLSGTLEERTDKDTLDGLHAGLSRGALVRLRPRGRKYPGRGAAADEKPTKTSTKPHLSGFGCCGWRHFVVAAPDQAPASAALHPHPWRS